MEKADRNIRMISEYRRCEWMQSRLKFANLLSQHYHINALTIYFLFFFFEAPVSSTFNATQSASLTFKNGRATRRQTLSDLVGFIRIIDSKSIHESTAAHLEFGLLWCREFGVRFLDSGGYKVRTENAKVVVIHLASLRRHISRNCLISWTCFGISLLVVSIEANIKGGWYTFWSDIRNTGTIRWWG